MRWHDRRCARRLLNIHKRVGCGQRRRPCTGRYDGITQQKLLAAAREALQATRTKVFAHARADYLTLQCALSVHRPDRPTQRAEVAVSMTWGGSANVAALTRHTTGAGQPGRVYVYALPCAANVVYPILVWLAVPSRRDLAAGTWPYSSPSCALICWHDIRQQTDMLN